MGCAPAVLQALEKFQAVKGVLVGQGRMVLGYILESNNVGVELPASGKQNQGGEG